MSDKIDSREQLLFILNERYIDQKNDDINDSEYKQSIDKYNDNKVESSSSLSSYNKANNVLDRRGIVNKISNISSLVSNRNKKKPVVTHLHHHHHNQYRGKQQINNSYISPYILLAEKRANDRIQIRRKYSSINHNEHSQYSNHNHNNHDDQNESKASVIKHKNGWNENVHIESSLFDPKLKKQEIFKIEPKVHYFYNKYMSKVNGSHQPHCNNDNNIKHNYDHDDDDDDLSSNHSGGYNNRLGSYNNNSIKQKLTIKTNGVRTHFL